MNLLYIDYENLHKSERKRLLFLKHLVNLSNQDSKVISYAELGLVEKDLADFIELLQKFNYNNYFIPNKEGLAIEKIDGKVLINLDLMIQDLEYIESKYNPESTIMLLTEKLKSSQNVSFSELQYYFNTLIVILFRKWLFKKINLPFIPYSEEGAEIFKKTFDNLSEQELRNIFDLQFLSHEIDNINMGAEDFENLKIIIKIITRDLENKYSSTYWTKLRIELVSILRKKRIINTEKLKIGDNSVLLIVKRGNIKKNPKNPIISSYNGRIVFFHHGVSLSRKLKINDIVLCEFDFEIRKNIVVRPLKVLNPEEVLYLLKEGIEHGQSKKEFYNLIR